MVETRKFVHLQLSQVKDVLRQVIQCVVQPKIPTKDGWHERLNKELMVIIRSRTRREKFKILKIKKSFLKYQGYLLSIQ